MALRLYSIASLLSHSQIIKLQCFTREKGRSFILQLEIYIRIQLIMPETVLWLFSLGVFLLKYVLWHDRWKASKKNYIPCNTCWTGSPWTCWSVVKMSHIVQYPNYTVCPLWRKTRVSVPLLLLVWHFSCSHKTLSTGNPVYLYQEDKVVLLQRIGHREGISSSWCARVRLSLSVLVKPLVLASVKKNWKENFISVLFLF